MKLMLACMVVASVCAQPRISAVVNAASGAPFVAPGSLISIFGSGLSTGTANATFAWPLSLGGSVVLACQSPTQCVNAGLLYVSPTQINAYIPSSFPASLATVSVTATGATSTAFPLAVNQV